MTDSVIKKTTEIFDGNKMANNTKNVIILEPLRVLLSFNDDQFEQMIEEWQTCYKGTNYKRVERIACTGDKGRDIRCTGIGLLNDLYIFQAKNYHHRLGISDIFPDMAKCCYYTYKGEYQVPRKFTFVSPLGVSPTVSDLFDDKTRLKKVFKNNWDKMCASKINKPKRIALEGKLLSYVDDFNFAIFNYVTPQELVDELKKTCYYVKYFQQLNKTRPLTKTPKEIEEKELVYIGKIIEAYDEYLGRHIEDVNKLKEISPQLWVDFKRHRDYFYSAETLSRFSRDIYSPESQWFEQIKEELYHAIIQDIEEDAKNGFDRLNKVMKRAVSLSIGVDNQPHSIGVLVQDRKGICHHLANEREEVRWKK